MKVIFLAEVKCWCHNKSRCFLQLLEQVNVSEEANCRAAAPTECCCNGDEGTLPGCEKLLGNITACSSETWKTTSSSPKHNLLPSGDGKSTGNTKIQMSLLEKCSRTSLCWCCPSLPQIPPPTSAFSQVYPDPESHIFSTFLWLNKSWNSYRRDGECFCPRTASQPKNWALFIVCYRFQVLQGEQGILWTSTGSLIPDLRSHIIPEAVFMPSLPLSQVQFPTPLCIHLQHRTRGMLFKRVPSGQRLASRCRCTIQAQPKIS